MESPAGEFEGRWAAQVGTREALKDPKFSKLPEYPTPPQCNFTLRDAVAGAAAGGATQVRGPRPFNTELPHGYVQRDPAG